MKAILAALLPLLATPALAQGDVSLDKDVTYYNVTGDTLEDIARSLRRDAPRDLDGFQGQANFWFSWTYNYDQVSSSRAEKPTCLVTNARV